jgi:hypothetical protein
LADVPSCKQHKQHRTSGCLLGCLGHQIHTVQQKRVKWTRVD